MNILVKLLKIVSSIINLFRDNFVIIYELFDEMMDYGFPQVTDHKLLQDYITQESFRTERASKTLSTVTNVVSWRPEGIVYKKNEIFLDIIEKLNLQIAANGNIISSDIIGNVHVKSNLSGMPELKLGLNDKLMLENSTTGSKARAIEMEDVRFHQCVRLAKFETDRTISFIPPDGEFELMNYRINTQVKPLIWVEASVHRKSSRINYIVNMKSNFRSRLIANDVVISVPVPSDVDSPIFKTSIGNCKYAPEKDCMNWNIKQLYGGKQYSMEAQFGLPSVEKEENEEMKSRPISVEFEIPYFAISGVQVRYLKISDRSGYEALPWVRYITENGNYFLRMR